MNKAQLVVLSLLALLVGIAYVLAAHPSGIVSGCVILGACALTGVSYWKG